jgi:hypothetical protein
VTTYVGKEVAKQLKAIFLRGGRFVFVELDLQLSAVCDGMPVNWPTVQIALVI